MFKNWKIGVKLIGGFILLDLFGLAMGVIGMMNIKKVNDAAIVLYENDTVSISELLNIAQSFQMVRLNDRDLFNAKTDEEKAKILNKISQLLDTIDSNSASLEKKILTVDGRKAFEAFIQTHKSFRSVLNNVINLIKQKKDSEARALIENVGNAVSAKEQAELGDLVDRKIALAKQTSDQNTYLTNQSIMIMLIITGAGLILSFTIGISITLSITGPMARLTEMAKKMADGDLSIEKLAVKSKDEIGLLGNSFNQMLENTNEVLSQINNSVEMVSSGSMQVSQSSQSLSQGASEQASSLEEITSSITEINSQTKQNTENAVTVNGLSKNSKENAEQGNRQMVQLVGAMEGINKSAGEIKKVVKTIDDIAFQINLLALNANAEAARAGKYGKGFAVVAEEVRNLAIRSANSVKETTSMVEDVIKNIENGNSLVTLTSKQLAEIVEGAAKVAGLVEEVAAASKEQSQGLDQISTALGQIDTVTQSNTANAEESASAAEELASQAQQLKAVVERFILRTVEIEAKKTPGLTPDILKLIRNEIEKEMENGHISPDKEKQHFVRNAVKQIVNPKEVIALDDGNFGKF